MLHLLFEKSVIEHPDRVAVIFEDSSSLTYKQLDEHSNRLAHLLLLQGIGLQDHVPVLLERGLMQVVVFLALLKIGAVYVPISPEQTPEQLKQILCDHQHKHLVTTSSLAQSHLYFFDKGLGSLVCLDKEEAQIARQAPYKPVISELNEHLIAYVVYSSGTTGTPKGIPIRHLGMTRYWHPVLQSQLKHGVLNVLSNVSIDFDAHIWEYLMAWSFSATLHIANEETRKDANRLAQFVMNHRISDMTLTPPMLRAFTDNQIEGFAKSGLKAIYSTGEACTLDIVSRFLQHRIATYNCYGPTEATFGLSMLSCRLQDFYENTAPIGLPPDGSIQLTIVNLEGQEVKEGEAGELVIGSPYLTPGYLNAKNDTFFTKKNEQTGLVHYKTGDKFIKRGDFLYYKGRAHSLAHVKIRGQLVHPAGIEEILRRHPHIKDASVSVRYDLGSEPCLVAFIVTNDPLDVRILREHCAKFLKASSIPNYFIPMDKLPLTINGKINKELLSKQEFVFSRNASNPYIVPLTQLEEHLIILWEKVLGVSTKLNIKIGTRDAFAVLGGDSIKLMLLKRHIEEALQVSINIAELGSFEELTVEKMAQHVYANLILKNAHKSIQLVKKGDKSLSPLFLLPPISGESILTYKKLCEKLECPQEVYAIEAPGLSDPRVTCGSISKMAGAYLALIRTIQPKDPLSLAGWSSGGLLVYEMALQLEKENVPAAFVGIVDEPSPHFQQLMSNEFFAIELVDLIAYFKQTHQFSFDCSVAHLSGLAKKEQILYAFSKISDTNPVANNLLAYMKTFLLATLDYDPPILESTSLAVFSTFPTINKFVTQAKDSRTMTTLPTLGWSRYSKLYVMISELKGDHFSIIEEPEELVRLMAHALQKMGRADNERSKAQPEKIDVSEKMIKELSAKLLENIMKTVYSNNNALPFFPKERKDEPTTLEPERVSQFTQIPSKL